jgi:signal transduction histidine kinase
LQTRVFVLIGVGVVVPLVALGIASWTSLNALRAELEDERSLLAASFAGHLGDVVRSNLELLQAAATAARVDPSDQDTAPEYAALRGTFPRAHLMRRVFVINEIGRVVAEEPVSGPAVGAEPIDSVSADEALKSGRPTVSNLTVTPGEVRRLYLYVPIHDWEGRVVGLVGGEVDPSEATFAATLRPFQSSPGGSVSLVDGAGTVLATTEPGRQFTRESAGVRVTTGASTESGRLATRAETAESGVAVAPLENAPWSVVVRERAEESAAALQAFHRRVLGLIPVLLGVGALFAWGAARSVTRPLVLLTRAADRIRTGDLGEAIPGLGPDEFGRLAEAFEAMRISLKQSIDEVERANQGLERRVDERTRELERLYRELRKRDESRGQLLSKVISAQEDERRRIARELHDETSQTLSALAMGLETTYTSAQTEAMRARLADAKGLTRRAIDELHRLIYDLRPSILDDLGLLPAITWFAERTLNPLGISVRCECTEIEDRFRPEFEIAVFRVVQEAITNIAKHAAAETVLVECALDGRDLVIDIQDDGRGFDPAAVATSPDSQRGLGLMGMRERMELVGGTVKVDSAPGRGTYVSVRVPVPVGVPRG